MYFLLKASVWIHPHREDLEDYKVEMTRLVKGDKYRAQEKINNLIIKENSSNDVDVLVGTVHIDDLTIG